MREEQIFHEVLEQAADKRAAFLAAACGADVELRQRVELLLQAQANPGSFLQVPAPGIGNSPTIDQPAAERLGTQIGPYKLLQQIGEGGMGTVYMAEQTHPVQRKVALKLIRPGLDNRQVIARFEAERQALALMDHPHIARVLDAGTTGEIRNSEFGIRNQETADPPIPHSELRTPHSSSGQPYFVMELVHGVAITKYCDQHRLTPRQRLELFVAVCQAIQHAHQKGIIHRDIKPSNVLIAQYDGKPVPKVIDFGVAKAVGQRLTESTLFTAFGSIVGTLEYMSPEQAEQNQFDIDTRSDIYSLGVLLYELLTGTTPLDKKHLGGAAFLEMLRIIKEDEPQRPSTRLSTTDELPSIAANRSLEPRKLSGLVRGELDWIVMKALEKDRARRYETANGFALDVQRYLADEPVQACPPSAGYRLRKFARRNKGPVLAGSLVALALVGGIIGTTLGMLRATKAEADAIREAGQKTVALGEKATALATATANEIQAKAAQKDAQENLQDALAAVDQMLTRVADDKLMYVPQMEPIRRELLLDALRFYQKFLEKQNDDPLIRREVILAHRRVAGIHSRFGQVQDAERAYRNAIAMFDNLGTSVFADTAFLREMVHCHIEFSWNLNALGKGEEAVQNIQRAVEVADRLDKNDSGNRGYIINARNHLAGAIRGRQPEVAEKILKGNLELASDASSLGATHGALGGLFMETGRLPQAEEAWRQAVKYAEQHVEENPSANWVQAALANYNRRLAAVISANQRPGEAEKIQRGAILILDQLATDFPAGPGYRQVLAEALIEHAALLKRLGQTADAEKAYRRAIDVYEKLATDFPTMPAYWQTTFDQRLNLGQFLKDAGNIEEASRVYQGAQSIVSKLPTDAPGQLAHHAGLIRAQCELGRMLASAGKKQEAETAFHQVVTLAERLEAEFGGTPEYRHDLALSHNSAASQLVATHHHADADRLFDWALQHYIALADASPQAMQSQAELAICQFGIGAHQLWDTRRLKDADRSLQSALVIFEKLAAQFPQELSFLARAATCRLYLAEVAQQDGRLQQAQEHLRQGIPLAERIAEELPSDGLLRQWLGRSYRLLVEVGGIAAPQEVEATLARSWAVLEKLVADVPGNDIYLSELGSTCRPLAEHHFRNGRIAEGRRFYERVVEHCDQMLTLYGNTATANAEWWLNNNAWFLVRRMDSSPRGAQLAVELARRAVAKEPKGFIVNTLGTAYYRAGEWQLAVETLTQAAGLLGPFNFSENAFLLAMALEKSGARDDARQWYTAGLVLSEKRERDNEELIQFRGEAAALLGLSENAADPAPRLDDVVEWARRQPHSSASQLAWVLGQHYEQEQQFARAEGLYREALEHVRQQFGAGDARAVLLLATLCRNLLEQQKYSDAEPVARECLALREKAQPDAWTTFNTRSMLGACLLGEKKFADAEPLLLDGYEGMKQREGSIPPLGRPRLTEAIERLVQLYVDWGQPEKAAQWRKKLVDM